MINIQEFDVVHIVWFIYILKCADSTLYTGITNDLGQRLKKHNQGKAAKYTKVRLPVKVIYSEQVENKSAALKREYQIKQLSRQQKMALVAGFTQQ